MCKGTWIKIPHTHDHKAGCVWTTVTTYTYRKTWQPRAQWPAGAVAV